MESLECSPPTDRNKAGSPEKDPQRQPKKKKKEEPLSPSSSPEKNTAPHSLNSSLSSSSSSSSACKEKKKKRRSISISLGMNDFDIRFYKKYLPKKKRDSCNAKQDRKSRSQPNLPDTVLILKTPASSFDPLELTIAAPSTVAVQSLKKDRPFSSSPRSKHKSRESLPSDGLDQSANLSPEQIQKSSRGCELDLDSSSAESSDDDGEEDYCFNEAPALASSDHFPLPENHSQNPDELIIDGQITSFDHSQSIDRIDFKWKKGNLIGSGSFGEVYLGLNSSNGQLIAVKQVPLTSTGSREVENLEREVSILRELEHENIVKYLGTSIEVAHSPCLSASGSENLIYHLNIFLEYVPGGSIHSLLLKFGSFPEEVIAMYTRQILLGLEYLHHHKIIHRDIKGANILVNICGNIKLADFGASKKIEGVVKRVNALRGTAYWMAPEVARQEHYGRKADIWSLGCTVLEMATGKPPLQDDFPDQVAALFHIAKLKESPPIPPVLSLKARDFIKHCLKVNPKERQSASQLLSHPFVYSNEFKDVSSSLKSTSNPNYSTVFPNKQGSREREVSSFRSKITSTPQSNFEASQGRSGLQYFSASPILTSLPSPLLPSSSSSSSSSSAIPLGISVSSSPTPSSSRAPTSSPFRFLRSDDSRTVPQTKKPGMADGELIKIRTGPTASSFPLVSFSPADSLPSGSSSTRFSSPHVEPVLPPSFSKSKSGKKR